MSRPCGNGPCLYTDAMEGFCPIFFLLVVLKIPVFGALWLVWWASREPEPETAGEDSDGGFKRRNPEPKLPRGPRRGPHGGGAGVGVAKRGRGAPLGQRRPAFRTAHSVSNGTRPAKSPATERGTTSPPPAQTR